MRVAPDELVVHRARDVVEITPPCSSSSSERKNDLEEEVAQLVAELRRVTGERGVGDLVGLLDGVRDDRASRLLAIPRTVRPEAPGQLPELCERSVRAHARDATRWSTSSGRSCVDVSGGSNPAAYWTLSLYSFSTSATHSLTAVFLLSESSWVLIWALTCANGVTEPGFTSESGWITW